LEITAYSDADWSGDKSGRRSTYGNIFFLGNAHVPWSLTKEFVVALLSCESEYIATCEASYQGVWMEFFMKGFK